MYRLRHFKEIYGKYCVGKLDSFTTYSIYDFHLFTFENLANNVFRLFTPCETIYLYWLYWYVLLLSIVKIVSEFHYNLVITFRSPIPAEIIWIKISFRFSGTFIPRNLRNFREKSKVISISGSKTSFCLQSLAFQSQTICFMYNFDHGFISISRNTNGNFICWYKALEC